MPKDLSLRIYRNDFIIHTNFLTAALIRLFYCNEYMNHWEKFNKTSLSEKEDFYRDLNMEDITRVDYT